MRKSPTRVLLAMWFAIVTGGAVYHLSCSDDDGKPPADAGVDFLVDSQSADVQTPDAPAADGPAADVAVDVPGLMDSMATDAAMSLNCDEIFTCFKACGQNCSGDTTCLMGCHTSCSAQGCASAQAAWGTVFGCTINNCSTECVADPSGTACDTCTTNSCGTEKSACLSNAC